MLIISSHSLFPQEEEDRTRRIHLHLLIDDPATAAEEAKELLKTYPDSKLIRQARIKALCEMGNEIAALKEWNTLVAKNRELLKDRGALETLAWGVIRKGKQSSQLAIEANALIGASMTRDAKAVPLILEALRGTNSIIRSLGVNLAAAYGDFSLQDEICHLLKEEKVWEVRLELIKAVGKLRLVESKDLLFEILSDPRAMAEERGAAIFSLVGMYDKVEDKELISLIQSRRAGLRQLACQVISHLNLKDRVELILPLLSDAHPSVRISALNTLALLSIDQLEGQPLMEHRLIVRLMRDPISEVAITASWLALLQGDVRGEDKLSHFLLQGTLKEARLAAGALAISGQKGVSLAKKGLSMEKRKDPFTQMALALGLIGQRESVGASCDVLAKHLNMGGKWMWSVEGNPLFRFIAPSQVTLSPQIANYPEVVNQLTRLEILRFLCILGYPDSQTAVKAFLRNHTTGTVGAASMTLLREGDDESLDVIRSLLDDPEEKIRVQAALILALFGGDKKAVDVLKTAYSQMDKSVKIQILQAIAKAGDPDAISFLLERLKEPFQLLRVVASTAIIQCLNH